MCNAWNHSVMCRCPFGGNTGGNAQAYFDNTSFYKSLFKDISRKDLDQNSLPLKASPTQESRTFEVKCPWCSIQVFYHTNGNGDSVYFDSLGSWKIHSCFDKYWKEEKERRSLLGTLSESQHISSANIAENEKRRRILFGVLQSIEGKRTEKVLANKMGLTLEELRRFYGHLYKAKSSKLKNK